MSKKTKQAPTIEGPLTGPLDKNLDCINCRSPEHTGYLFVRSEPIDGRLITWKRTSCRQCGQVRVNRFASPIPSETSPRA